MISGFHSSTMSISAIVAATCVLIKTILGNQNICREFFALEMSWIGYIDVGVNEIEESGWMKWKFSTVVLDLITHYGMYCEACYI